MVDDTIAEYGNWKRIDPVYPDFQLVVVRNEETGDVLAVEHAPSHAPHDRGEPYQVVLLPEDYYEYNEVKEYLTKGVSKSEAYQVATLYVEENT